VRFVRWAEVHFLRCLSLILYLTAENEALLLSRFVEALYNKYWSAAGRQTGNGMQVGMQVNRSYRADFAPASAVCSIVASAELTGGRHSADRRCTEAAANNHVRWKLAAVRAGL